MGVLLWPKRQSISRRAGGHRQEATRPRPKDNHGPGKPVRTRFRIKGYDCHEDEGCRAVEQDQVTEATADIAIPLSLREGTFLDQLQSRKCWYFGRLLSTNWFFASFTTWPPAICSTRHGGGKRRVIVMCSCAADKNHAPRTWSLCCGPVPRAVA